MVGFKNQQELREKFQSIAYSCKMANIKDQLKLPEVLPSRVVNVKLPNRDYKTSKALSKEFIAECAEGKYIVLKNVLNKILRLQQITSGFCVSQDTPGAHRRSRNSTR